MVAIAQSVERLVVVQEVAGSSPVSHPTERGLLSARGFVPGRARASSSSRDYADTMVVHGAFPILSTGHLDRLVEFYRAAFDAEQTDAFADADGRDVYVSLSVGGSSLGIGLDAEADVPDGRDERTSLWFYVDDVDESYRRALGAGARPESEPADMPWGERVARVRDPDGLVIHLGAEG
jgi:uncharacterized glyoxalase superfamily protein PhnB